MPGLSMTSDPATEAPVKIEPFDPEFHDRAAFSCGARRIDNFLKLTAKMHQRADFTRVWVAVDGRTPTVLGYYAINSHAIDAGQLPENIRKKSPSHGRVGAAYISAFGVDSAVQGRGIGTFLISDALKRIARISEEMGIWAVVLDVLDDGDTEKIRKRHAFYRDFGFIDFASPPLRMYLPVATIRRGMDDTEGAGK